MKGASGIPRGLVFLGLKHVSISHNMANAVYTYFKNSAIGKYGGYECSQDSSWRLIFQIHARIKSHNYLLCAGLGVIETQ